MFRPASGSSAVARCFVPLRAWVVAVLAAGMVAAPVALAQPEICARPPSPDIPEGGSAPYAALTAARTAVDAYLDRMQDYLDCLQEESVAASAETDRVVDRWNEAVNAFETKQQE